MLNERIAELIQARVDGELAPGDRDELEQALETSEDARLFLAEMQRVSDYLGEVPDVDPPWGLRRRIMDSIQLPAKSSRSRWFMPASYGLAVAAGVLMAIGVSRVNLHGQDDLRGLVGTMVSQGQDLARQVADELAIDHELVKGQVRLKSLDQAYAVEFDLESADEVVVRLDLSHSNLRFGGFADQDKVNGVENFQVSGGNVRVLNRGNHQFVLFLRSEPGLESGSQGIGVSVDRQGTVIFEGVLESRG